MAQDSKRLRRFRRLKRENTLLTRAVIRETQARITAARIAQQLFADIEALKAAAPPTVSPA